MTESVNATPLSQENPYPPVISYPGPFDSFSYPPGPPGAYPPFFPPPLDCTHAKGTQNGGPPQPYMTYVPPPGVMYAYPHTQPQGFGAQPAAIPVPAILSRPKRKQVKMAFTNTAGACKRCDETRPCARCLKYGIGDTCVDGQRKERKKGIKRGPYKRKNKDSSRCLPENDGPPLSTLAEDIWKAMLTWADSKREKLMQKSHDGYKLEKRVLEIIHMWARHSGEDALRRAEYTLEKRRFKPTDIEQHIKQLLELMEQEYWRECWEFTSNVRSTLTLPWHREMFKEMFKEIPSLIEMHRRLRLRYFTLEARLSDTLDKILRLSSGTPSSTHNKNLRELLRNALLILKDLGGDEKYHDELRKRKNKAGYSPNFFGDWSPGSQPPSASTTAADPPFDTTECLPENYGPPLSTLAEDIWKAMLTWAESKRENLMQTNHDTNDLEVIEKRALEMIHSWARRSGRDVLRRAEDVLEERRVKPTNTEQHIEQLLKLMDQEYRHGTPFMCESTIWSTLTLSSRKEMFKEMLKEIPTLVGMHQRLGLRYFTLEAQFSSVLDKILRLSSWTPSSTHNKHLHKMLRNALLMLKDLGGNEEYHDDLRNFMKQHTAFCAFTLDNAYAITAEDSKTTTDLCRNLRRLAQNLGKIASTKAEQYQKLYENFIAHKEELSHLLDSASPGQGRSLVDNFTNSLKDMASSMRREADFWNSQSIQFHKWPDIRQTYGSALESMPPFPSEQLNDDRSSTAHGSVTQNTEPDPQHVPQAAQQMLATFSDLQKLRVNTTQAFLVKSENAISKRMRETRGYLEFVVNVFERQLSQPSEGCLPLVIARLAEKALCIAKRWNKLQRKVKFWSNILSIFSKPLACQTFDMASGISQDDFSCRVIATPDTPIHPYLIELEICLRKMGDHFLSRTHFWARVDSDPATFTSWRLAVLNEI